MARWAAEIGEEGIGSGARRCRRRDQREDEPEAKQPKNQRVDQSRPRGGAASRMASDIRLLRMKFATDSCTPFVK